MGRPRGGVALHGLTPPCPPSFIVPPRLFSSSLAHLSRPSTPLSTMSAPMMASYAALFGLWTLTQFVLVRCFFDTCVEVQREKSDGKSKKMRLCRSHLSRERGRLASEDSISGTSVDVHIYFACPGVGPIFRWIEIVLCVLNHYCTDTPAPARTCDLHCVRLCAVLTRSSPSSDPAVHCTAPTTVCTRSPAVKI